MSLLSIIILFQVWLFYFGLIFIYVGNLGSASGLFWCWAILCLPASCQCVDLHTHIKSLLTVSGSEYIYPGYKKFFYSNSWGIHNAADKINLCQIHFPQGKKITIMLAFLLFLLYCRVYSDYRYDIIIKLSTPPHSFYLFSCYLKIWRLFFLESLMVYDGGTYQLLLYCNSVFEA